MKRRTVIGSLMAVGVSLVAGVGAFAAAHGHREAIWRRVATAAIDDALDRAQATAEQRAQIQAARDRLAGVFEAHGNGRSARMAEVLALFEADQVDPGRVQALRRQIEEEHAQIADAVSQALVEAHDVLTPDQRRAVAGYVRTHHQRMH